MTAKFRRFFIPAVRFGVLFFEFANLDGRGLRMEWEVTRDNTSTPDEGVVRMFNLAPRLSGELHELWEARAPLFVFKSELEIGWDGVPQKLMTGDTWELIPEERTPTDVVTVLRFGDGTQAFRDQVTGRSFANTKVDLAINYLVITPPAGGPAGFGGLGLEYSAQSKAFVAAAAGRTNVPLLRNLVQGKDTHKIVDDLMATIGLEWRVHNGEFLPMFEGVIQRPGPTLRPRNGLLHYQKRNDGGCVCDAYANPDVEPGAQLQVQNNLGRPYGEPLYRVERVAFRGNTVGESVMRVEAAKVVIV